MTLLFRFLRHILAERLKPNGVRSGQAIYPTLLSSRSVLRYRLAHVRRLAADGDVSLRTLLCTQVRWLDDGNDQLRQKLVRAVRPAILGTPGGQLTVDKTCGAMDHDVLSLMQRLLQIEAEEDQQTVDMQCLFLLFETLPDM